MQEYRFICLDTGGNITTSCYMDAKTDSDAKEIANDLLLETKCYAVEVWHQAKLVHRAARPSSD